MLSANVSWLPSVDSTEVNCKTLVSVRMLHQSFCNMSVQAVAGFAAKDFLVGAAASGPHQACREHVQGDFSAGCAKAFG